MPMDKPNFALFPRFLSLAPPKLWDLRPIRGNQEHKYSAHKGASLTYSGRLSNEGPLPPTCPSNYDAHKYLRRRKCRFKSLLYPPPYRANWLLFQTPLEPSKVIGMRCLKGSMRQRPMKEMSRQNGQFYHLLQV